MHLSWAAASHTGLRRSLNEDSYCGRPDLGLFVVADGMGGHVAGEVASRLAVETVERSVAETVTAGANDAWPVPFEPDQSVGVNRLKAAFFVANCCIASRAATNGDLRGMATTATAVLVQDRMAAVAHVGDSRVYLMHAGTLRQLTRDHSWVEDQVRARTLSVAAARHHPWRNVVTRALAGGDDSSVDVMETPLEPGDRLLLCSDGLFAVIPDQQIQTILERAIGLSVACERLVEAANDGGGPDNITTLVLQLDAD